MTDQSPAHLPRLDGPRLAPASGRARNLVVFLHGYGADGNDLIDIGRAWQHLLPDTDRLRREDVGHLLAHTLPVPAAWVAARTHRHRPPAGWQRYPVLRDLVLLPAPADDREHTEHFGSYRLRMDDDLGLVTARTTVRASTGAADAPTATAGTAQHRGPTVFPLT